MAKILVVDDDRNFVEVIKPRLESIGHEIVAAYDGQEGYEKACSQIPDLIILDLILPKMDGYKFCQMIRSDERYKAIPIIMLTARGKGLDLEKIVALEFGADEYITKPFDTQEMLSKISGLLEKKLK